MNKTRFFARCLAWLLTLCTLVGLLPSVAVFNVAAEGEDTGIEQETRELLSQLNTSYSSLQIPQTKAKYVTAANINHLDGTYFLIIMAKSQNANVQHRMINYGEWIQYHPDRLSENCYKNEAAENCAYYRSLWVDISNWNTGNDSFNVINDFPKPDNLLDYAVELQKYAGPTVIYNTTTYYKEDTDKPTPYSEGYGWQSYNLWEFYRSNDANAGYASFADYVGLTTAVSTSDPAYAIKSLHPVRGGNPYLGCSTEYGWVSFLDKPFPIFFKENNKVGYDNKTFKMYKVSTIGENVHSYWFGIDNFYGEKPINAHTLSQIVREDKNQNTTGYPGNNAYQHAMDWELIQVSPLTLELYKAIYKAKSYVVGENRENRYPGETYLGFLRYLQQAMAEYNTHRATFNTDKNNEVRIRVDAIAKDLESYMALLEIEANPNSYLDVSLEVLDFRADGLLFEGLNSSTAYGLAENSPAVDGVAFPGNPQPGEENTASYVEGLIEPYLKDGHIIYKEETIEYIATALHKQHHTFADPSVSGFNAGSFDPQWNSVFMTKVSAAGAPLDLGSWDETKNKIKDKENGGFLPFSSVSTCYDLAYYILTNIWRESEEGDYVDPGSQLPYNMRIKELHTLRLLKETDGQRYAFRSALENGRNLDYGLIYNYPSGEAATDLAPYLNAVADLGFESASMLGNNSTGPVETSTNVYGTRNFHVMYHMQCAFVYYESKNQSFEFGGDDDVYFFVNDQLVCDIGGMHSTSKRSKSFNGKVARDLGLEDGDICTLDMYLVDRHSTGINLNFSTNIEMMPVGAITEKVQYFYTAPGIPETEIREGAAVADGTEVGYGFKLLNSYEHAAQNLTFTDETLGVSLSGSKVSLGNYGKAKELTLVYTTYDPLKKELSTDSLQSYNYDIFYEILEAAVLDMTSIEPLEDGVYCISGLTESQIMELIKLGIPANVQLVIYGFHRPVYSNPGAYTNTLHTSFTPIEKRNDDGTFLYGNVVLGSGKRSLKVQPMDTVSANPFRTVVDYGKPLDITVTDIMESLYYNSQVANVSFMGVRLGGEHGSSTPFKPSYLYLEKNGDTLTTGNGVYKRIDNTIRFTPTGFLEHVDRIYAIICVTDAYVSGNWYLTVSMDIVPANMMYYEAESFEGTELVTLKKDGEESETWSIASPNSGQETDGEAQDYERVGEEGYDMVIDREYIPGDAFFVDFDGQGYARRYRDHPQYAGYDFDNQANWSVFTRGASDTKILGVDHTAGILTFQDILEVNANGEVNHWNYIHSGTDDSKQILRYAPGENDIMQIRMKIRGGSMIRDTFTVSLEMNNGVTATYYGTGTYGAEYMDGNYHTFTVPLNYDAYRTADTLTCVRPVIHWTQGCTFTVDYIYIGSEQALPHEIHENYMFFDFNATNHDAVRYKGSYYGGVNFDMPSSWDAPADSNGLQITGGMAILEDHNRVGEIRWDYMETKGANNMPLSYKITKNDVLQVRLKIEGGREISADIPQVRVEFMTSEGLKHAGNVQFNYNNSSRPWLMSVYSGQFYTFTVPLNDGEYLKRTTLQSLRFVMYNIEGTDANGNYDRYTIDYIYLGPAHLAKEIRRENDHLFFDFTNSNAEALRYSKAVYGSVGNNYGELGKWATDVSSQITGLDTGAGTITFKDIHTADYNFIQPGGNNGEWSLNYKPGKNDVLRVRMKVNQGSTANSEIAVRLECNKGQGVIVYGEKVFSSAYMDGKYHVFTVPLWDVYRNLTVLDGFRLVLLRMQGCTFTVDYIYVGPLKASNPVNQSLYFGFENTAEDRLRYDSETYGRINFDRWEPNNTGNKANWATAYGTAQTQNGDGLGGNAFEINNRAGTIATYPGNTVTGDDNQIYRVDLQPTLTYGDYQFSQEVGMPLRFRPDRADVIRIRLRLENCLDGSEEDPFINDEGWNEARGEAPATPCVEIRVNYWENGVRKEVAPNTYTAPLDVTTGEYQILTIPLGDHLGQAEFVECIALQFFHIKNGGKGKITIDDIYVGPGDNRDSGMYAPTYGYDSTYANDSNLSDGRSLFVEGNGVKLPNTMPDKYTEATFSFTGTGFDIISRTGKDQATIRVEIYDHPRKTENDLIKTLTVNGKGELELYQIPLVSVQGLPHGTYHVTIMVNDGVAAPNIPGVDMSFLARGNDFYFDALRIYDPIDVSGETLSEEQALALKVYLAQGEAYQYIKEIRNLLLTKAAFDTLNGTIEGGVYVDMVTTPTEIIDVTNGEGETTGETVVQTPDGINVKDHYTAKVETYNKVGPKNEVYLAPGQAVAFRLAVDTKQALASLDIGAKIIKSGSEVQMAVGFVVGTDTVEGLEYFDISTATARYYAMNTADIRYLNADSNREVYLVIYNATTGDKDKNILSLTDIKVAYSTKPYAQLAGDSTDDPEIRLAGAARSRGIWTEEAPARFLMDRKVGQAVESFVKAVMETPVEEDAPALAEGIRILHSLDLTGDIAINYVVSGAEVEDFHNITMVCRIPEYEGNSRVGSREVVLYPRTRGEYVYFTLTGLTAVNMNDTVEAYLSLYQWGREYVTSVDTYSIARYAYAQLDKEYATVELKALCADLLRYGAEAQCYKGYRTDSPADSAMTEEHRTYLTEMDTVSFDSFNTVEGDVESSGVLWAGKALLLDTKVAIRYVVDLSGYTGDFAYMHLRVKYRDANGTERCVSLWDPELYNEERGYYSFDFDGLLVAELRQPVSATVYVGTEPVTGTLQYSASTYGANKTGTLGILCKCLMAYSDSAKTFFAK